MNAFLLTSLIFVGIAISTPDAQARDRKHRDHDRVYRSYYIERPSCESRSYQTEYYPRESYRRDYYEPEPRYSYEPERHYSYSEPRYYHPESCHVERRHSYRPPAISFLFGF